jgi:hypothetical protein
MELVDGVYVVSTMASSWADKPTLKTLDDIGIFTKENIYGKRLVIQYDQPNEARKFLMERLDTSGIWGNKEFKTKWFNLTLNHYYTICSAISNNSSRMLLLEDDCALHSRLEGIIEMLDDIPDDFDAINFFAGPPGSNVGVPPQYRSSKNMKVKLLIDQLKANNGNSHFKELTSTCRCANCVLMSRRFMERLVGLWNGWFSGKRMMGNDNYWRKDLFPDMKMYMSTVPLFVQKWTSNETLSPPEIYKQRLEIYGLKAGDIL